MKRIGTYRAQNTNVHKSLRKVSSTLQQCIQAYKIHTQQQNINLHTYFNRLAQSHTQIYGAIRGTRVTTRNRLSGCQHNKHIQISATQIPEPHANKAAAKRTATVADTQEVTILQEFQPNTTRAFFFSRTRVTRVARTTSLT